MKIEIFGKTNCNYCEQAKQLLKIKSIDYSYVDFFTLSEEDQSSVMEKAPSARSYPIILIDGVYVGGFDDIRAAI